MENLPRLLKPYYTISEAFHRLNLAGANLDKESDIHLICAEGEIEINLLVDDYIQLINQAYARPYRIKERFNCQPSEDEVQFAIEHLGYTENSVHMEFVLINSPSLMIPWWICDGNLSEEVEKVEVFNIFELSDELKKQRAKQCHEQLLEEMSREKSTIHSFPSTTIAKPTVVTPYRMPEDYRNKCLGEPIKFNINVDRDIDVYFALGALELDGDIYYTCKSIDYSYFSEMFEYKITLKNGTEYWPSSVLKSSYINKAIRDNSFVVTRENIQKYEREYLDIQHEIDTYDTPSYLDKNSPYYAEELTIAIEAHTAIFINKEGSQHQSLSSRVATWLSKHYPEKCQSDSFVKRITAVVLPKKNRVT